MVAVVVAENNHYNIVADIVIVQQIFSRLSPRKMNGFGRNLAEGWGWERVTL